jgi:hypothetical protein
LAIDATSGQLLLYGRTESVPFAPELTPSRLTPAAPTDTVAELRKQISLADAAITEAATAFFEGYEVDIDHRLAILRDFTAPLPDGLLPWYRALAPDFFSWLEDADETTLPPPGSES